MLSFSIVDKASYASASSDMIKLICEQHGQQERQKWTIKIELPLLHHRQATISALWLLE